MVTTEPASIPWFARSQVSSWREDADLWESSNKSEMLPPYLPKDPRSWTREEVCQWVNWTLTSHSLPCPEIERFLMNGKAVCLMSVAMFTTRVPLGGKLLYRDFQIRLAEAMAKQ